MEGAPRDPLREKEAAQAAAECGEGVEIIKRADGSQRCSEDDCAGNPGGDRRNAQTSRSTQLGLTPVSATMPVSSCKLTLQLHVQAQGERRAAHGAADVAYHDDVCRGRA